MLLHHFVGCGDGQNEDLAKRHMATVGCRSYYSSLLGADLGTLTLVCVFPFRFPSPSPESHVVASQGRLLSEFHCSGQMCGHNLINVRLCHCFFLCSVATCRDNLVARLNFVFPYLLQPQLFDSTSIRGSQRGHVLVQLARFSFCVLAQARQETSLSFQ